MRKLNLDITSRLLLLSGLMSGLALTSTVTPARDELKSLLGGDGQAVAKVQASNANKSGVTSTSSQSTGHPPTPIQLGVMSPQQRVHSKLYENYKNDRTLDALPSEWFADGREPGVYIGPGLEVWSADAPHPSFEELLRNLECEADAVAIGVVKRKESQLTDNKEFIFTDYVVVPSEIFKRTALSVPTNQEINITRPGGRIQLNGRTIGAIDSSFKLLSLGKTYLFFLKRIPETGAYQSLQKGTYEINDGALTAMTEESVPGGDKQPFNAELHNLLSRECK